MLEAAIALSIQDMEQGPQPDGTVSRRSGAGCLFPLILQSLPPGSCPLEAEAHATTPFLQAQESASPERKQQRPSEPAAVRARRSDPGLRDSRDTADDDGFWRSSEKPSTDAARHLFGPLYGSDIEDDLGGTERQPEHEGEGSDDVQILEDAGVDEGRILASAGPRARRATPRSCLPPLARVSEHALH